MEAVLALVGLVALIPLMVLYGSMSWGYVLLKFWTWFMLPVFTTVPHITFWQAVGLMLVISMFKGTGTLDIKDEYKEDKWHRIAYSLMGPWLTLACGWFLHLFM